jgi:ammonium transporter, Amt family
MNAVVAAVAQSGPPFTDQVSGMSFMEDTFYAVATVSLFLVIAALGLIDGGLVRRKNLLDTWVQKLICAFIAGVSLTIIGFAIWEVQYYQALQVPDPIIQAIKDWWLAGNDMRALSQNLNPAVSPQADVFQIFVVFFVAFAAVGGALLHSAGLERVKAGPMYVISAIAGGLIIPIALYLTWGSTSPLTNLGVHDYVGTYSLYIVVGTWALIIAWRAGPRLGAFRPHPRTSGPVPHDWGSAAFGVILLLVCEPFLSLGCGYLTPGAGYYGISLTTSGFGIVMVNVFMAFLGGGLSGAFLAYRSRNPVMALLGAVAGIVGAGTSLDTGMPWELLIVGFIAPFVVYGVIMLLTRMGIDDKKIVPLALGGGIYSAIAGGIVGWGHKTGGYFGLKGTYAPQHATINVGWQLLGVVVIVAIAAVSGLIVVLALEKTVGLRVSENDEVAGLDCAYWDATPGGVVAGDDDTSDLVGTDPPNSAAERVAAE